MKIKLILFTHRSFLSVLGFIFVCFFLSGCSGKGRQSHSIGRAWLTPELSIALPKANEIPMMSVQQLLTVNYGKYSQSFMVILEANENELTLIGLSTLGIRLFSIKYTPSVIEVEVNISIKELPAPEQVLADIMFSYGTEDILKNYLPQNWTLVDQGNQRFLIDEASKEVIVITYDVSGRERKPIVLKHQLFGYEIQIQNLN